MKSRRRFIQNLALGTPILLASPALLAPKESQKKTFKGGLVISTWGFGMEANKPAWELIKNNKSALDAVEAGVQVAENDAFSTSVGLAAYPDRDGIVTLDACVMDENGKAGSVCGIERIKSPVAVARMVMEKTPHVILVGAGAQQFAVSQGFELQPAKLSDHATKAYKEWLKTSEYKPIINFESHDTIGMIALDKMGNASGACTTSGLSFKMHGRVGDSPIIGAGLYVDNEIGAATGTGLGEIVLRSCSTFLIVELMRHGKSPQKACEEAIRRIIKKNSNAKDFQVAFIACNKAGEIGGYAIHPGFEFAVCRSGEHILHKAGHEIP